MYGRELEKGRNGVFENEMGFNLAKGPACEPDTFRQGEVLLAWGNVHDYDAQGSTTLLLSALCPRQHDLAAVCSRLLWRK